MDSAGRKPISLSERDWQMIWEYFNSDKTMKEVAVEYEVPYWILRYKIKRYQKEAENCMIKVVKETSRPLTETELQMIQEYVDTNTTMTEIAVKYGISFAKLQRIMKKYQEETGKYVARPKGRRATPFTETELQMIHEYLNTDKSLDKVASEYGISVSTLRYKLNRYQKETGTPIKKVPTETDLQMIREYFDSDKSLKEIAVKYGTTVSKLFTRIKRYQKNIAEGK